MSVLTRVKVLGVVGVCIIGFVGYQSLVAGEHDPRPPRIPLDDDISETVTVTVTSTPPNRPRNPARVLVFVEGAEVDEATLVGPNPYRNAFVIPRGAHLDVDVEQSRDGILECVITVRNKIEDINTTRTRGILECKYPKIRK
jgi:hypothetical protein